MYNTVRNVVVLYIPGTVPGTFCILRRRVHFSTEAKAPITNKNNNKQFLFAEMALRMPVPELIINHLNGGNELCFEIALPR
jgi:hypothetical protein